MRNFVLEFEKKESEKSYLFPIPQNNQYQKISRLSLPEDSQQLTTKNDTLVAIFPSSAKTSIKFRYQGQNQSFNWQKLEFSKQKNSPYFNSDQFINSQDREVQILAKNWLGNETDPKKIVRILYENTLAYLSYDNPIPGLHPYSQALEERVTDCGGFATFLISLIQSQGIPSRLVVGYLLKNRIQEKLTIKHSFKNISMHAWLEVQLADNSWLPLDPAVDWRYRHGKSQRQASLENIPSDRLVLSYGHLQELKWQDKKYQWPILQHPEIIDNNV